MPTLNLKLDSATNLKLNELVLALTIQDPNDPWKSNRSHAARKAIIELHAKLCNGLPRTLATDLQEDR